MGAKGINSLVLVFLEALSLDYRKKSEAGQAQLLITLLFLFFISASVIIAQNATNGTNSSIQLEGDVILLNETILNQSVDSYTAEGTDISSGTPSYESVPSDFTVIEPNNETNETVLEKPENQIEETLPETQPEEPPAQEPFEISAPHMIVWINSPEKITRGVEFSLKATASNDGNADAKNVVLKWQLPDGFEIVSGNPEENCELPPGSACSGEITVRAAYSTPLGKNDIKVRVRYVG